MILNRCFNSVRINTEIGVLIFQHHHHDKQLILGYILINIFTQYTGVQFKDYYDLLGNLLW